MVTRPAFTDRVQHVELRIAGEILAVALILFVFFSALSSLSWAPRATVSLALIAAATLSLYRRWRQRLTRWHALTNWSTEPLRRDGPYVVQVNSAGEPTTVIDTRARYTVTWERFDARRAVYMVKQGDEQIVVSTLAPNAPEILRESLNVRNYPCEEWPNFDL